MRADVSRNVPRSSWQLVAPASGPWAFNIGGVPAAIIPVGVFLVTPFVSFSDGSSWSTYGIMFPTTITAVLFLLFGVLLPEGFRVIPY